MINRLLHPILLDRYIIRLMLRPMLVAIAITMAALLLERTLRLFELVTDTGADIGPVLTMALVLSPHYLSLVLPASFSIAILSTLSRMSRNNELDVLESAGWSLRRIGAAFLVVACFLSVFSIISFGVIQPYSRYAYRAIKHQVINAVWDGRVERGVFFDVGNGLVISAEDVEPTGQLLHNIFVFQRNADGESVITANRAAVLPDQVEGAVNLLLENGVTMTADSTGRMVRFERLALSLDMDVDKNPFRPRGSSEREMTFRELLSGARGSDGFSPEPRVAAEFHARLVRAFSLLGVALLSVPFGVVRKRTPAWPRIVVAVILLAGYNHAIQITEDLADLGVINPAVGLWSLWTVFMMLAVWIYATTPSIGSVGIARAILIPFDALQNQIMPSFKTQLDPAQESVRK